MEIDFQRKPALRVEESRDQKRKNTHEKVLRDSLLTLVKKNRQLHIYSPDIHVRYLVLKILSKVASVFYVTKNEHTEAIAKFLNQWEDFGVFVQSAVYLKDSEQKKFSASLVVASEEYIYHRLSNTKDMTFTKLLIFEEGLELTAESKYIYQIWKHHVDNKPRLIYFDRPENTKPTNKVYGFSHRDLQTVVVYLNTDPTPDQIYDRVTSLILKQYAVLNRGCCIVVFVANIDQELELRDRLFQIADYIISTISGGRLNTIPTSETPFRPRVIITNHEHDVRSLSDVSIVVDLMMEEYNNEIRYISKHRARLRLERVNMEGGRCYRMMTFKTYNAHPATHIQNLHPHHHLRLMDRSKTHHRGIEIELGKRTLKKLIESYFFLGLMDNKNLVTTLGRKASKIAVQPKTFRFIHDWNEKGYKIFPAVIIAALLEMGKHGYFLTPDSYAFRARMLYKERYNSYYGRDDIATFLNVYTDMLNSYGGFPDLTEVEDIIWLQNWTNERDLDYNSLRKITLDITRILRDFNLASYEFTLGGFNTKKASDVTRDIVSTTHTNVHWSDQKQGYLDSAKNRYIFGPENYHTLQHDEVEDLIVLEFSIDIENKSNKNRYIKLAMAKEPAPKDSVPIPPTFTQIEEAIVIWSKYMNTITPESYIDRNIKSSDIKDKIIDNQVKNTKLMAPKYSDWFESTPRINTFVTRDGYMYTEAEIVAVDTPRSPGQFEEEEINIVSTSPALKHRSIEILISAVVSWEQRGYMLLEREYITQYVKNGESVVYVGFINEALALSFPDVIFYELEFSDTKELEKAPTGAHLIVTDESYPENYSSHIDKLKPKSALFVFRPNQNREKYLHYPGLIKIVPFMNKESTETRIIVDQPHNKKLIEYDVNTYLDQMYYHNLVRRQTRTYRPSIGFPARNNYKRPEKDYLVHDTCYDCRREGEIHIHYLARKNKGKAYDKKLSLYSEIEEISFALKHDRSLYYGMHGRFTGASVPERRELYEDYKRSLVKERTTGQRRKGVRMLY